MTAQDPEFETGAYLPWEDPMEYVPIDRPDALVRCPRCGAVIEGNVAGQAMHNVWHSGLDRQIEKAARWRPAPVYGGQRRPAPSGDEVPS
jgi:hypothetical protein